MKIKTIETARLQVPLVTPFKTALRTVREIDTVLVRATTASGVVGYGEAPPTAAITGETVDSILGAIHGHLAPAVRGADVLALEGAMARLHGAMAGNTSAKAAVDMALYDAHARALGQPLWRVLGGARGRLQTDITISVGEAGTMAEDSRRAVAGGYRILKVKVGKGGRSDAERILAVARAAGPDVVLRIDANQGWTAEEAIAVMRQVEAAGLAPQLLEQPLPADDLAGMRRVRRSITTPVLADESVFSARQMLRVLQEEAADYINIKLMKTGGIHRALQLCALAEVHGVPCMMGCMLESKLAVSAGAHLAAGRSIITMADLDGPALAKEDPYTGGPAFCG